MLSYKTNDLNMDKRTHPFIAFTISPSDISIFLRVMAERRERENSRYNSNVHNMEMPLTDLTTNANKVKCS